MKGLKMTTLTIDLPDPLTEQLQTSGISQQQLVLQRNVAEK
jgi:hypothetical protein